MESFKECGWPGFLILFVAGIGFTAGVTGLILSLTQKPRPGKMVSIAGLVVSLFAIGIGPLGTMYGRKFVDDVVSAEAIEPSLREKIREQGYREAAQCIKVGVFAGALPTLLAAMGVVIGILGSRKPD